MKNLAFLSGFLGVVACVCASPTPEWDLTASNSTDVQKRAVGGVFICTDINWGGRCGYKVQPINECIVLGSDWDKQISSFGPDQCTQCTANVNHNCGQIQDGTAWDFSFPGDATGGLGTNNPWNDKISSFICFQAPCTSTLPPTVTAIRTATVV